MTDNERPYEQEEYAGKSGSQLARELLRLLLVLLWRMLLWCVRKVLKGVLWCMQTAETGWTRLNVWWHDNDTQEKVAKTKAWIRHALRTAGRWSVVAGQATLKALGISARATWKGLHVATQATAKGIVVAARATVEGLIHLRPTLKRVDQLTVQGIKATWAWMKACRRGMRLQHLQRKRAYAAFRRNGGVKGLIINTTRSVRNGIQLFMEEDQEEATPEAVTEDDLMEEVLAEGANEGKRGRKIGQSLLAHAKDFMDVDNE